MCKDVFLLPWYLSDNLAEQEILGWHCRLPLALQSWGSCRTEPSCGDSRRQPSCWPAYPCQVTCLSLPQDLTTFPLPMQWAGLHMAGRAACVTRFAWVCGHLCFFWLFTFGWDELLPSWLHPPSSLHLALCRHGVLVGPLLQGHCPLCTLAGKGGTHAQVLHLWGRSLSLSHLCSPFSESSLPWSSFQGPLSLG